MLMMDVYYAACRLCCCCPNSDDRGQQEWRQQKKDIEYVLHQQDISASAQSGVQNLSSSLHPNSAGTPTHSAKYVVPYIPLCVEFR